jgi:hypothetical protein
MNTLLPFTPDADGPGAYLYAASSQSTAALESLQMAVEMAFQLVWYNSEFTPEQMVAAMGNKAAANFDRHATTVVYLLTMGVKMNPERYTPPREYIKNADGTITLK